MRRFIRHDHGTAKLPLGAFGEVDGWQVVLAALITSVLYIFLFSSIGSERQER